MKIERCFNRGIINFKKDSKVVTRYEPWYGTETYNMSSLDFISAMR
jgi:hypothetical protein